jgi:hypothetical protein
MDENKKKRVLSIKLDDDVKKVSITGKDGEEKVVMRQELSEDDLEQATGGYVNGERNHTNQIYVCSPLNSN